MIYTEGCLPKASHWFERHILPVAIVVAVLAVLQILGICFAQNLRNDILAQKAKWSWHTHPMMNYYRHQRKQTAMEPIKNALSQAGDLVQQVAHTVVDAIRGTDNEQASKDNDDKPKTEQNIDSKQKKFDKEQDSSIQKSEITTPPGGYQDSAQQSDAKVLATSWPDLVGKSRHDAEEYIKARGYSNIKVMKKGTSSTTEHDESRVILFVDDNDVIVEEPKVG
ncbi:unnamed protein product [Adineta ricciae]|uniref:Uncharacterized protein n=2 Tax=Adineta ricciae TaxID=249248 RepID=A0A815PVB7_ADIRI|nr:unnamed protein product [Adineta ricciae]